MKIAYCITRLKYTGGAQIHIKDMSLAMGAHGHEAFVVGGQVGVFARVLGESRVDVVPLRFLKRSLHPGNDFLACNEIVQVLRKKRPDIVSLHSSKAGTLGRIAARRARVPAVFTAHGWAFASGAPWPRRALAVTTERFVSKWADRIVTVSSQDRDLALRYRIAPAEKLVVIHNGMPDDTRRADPGCTASPLRLVMVGRFLRPKDHALLLRALSECSFAWQLDLVGGGPGQEKVQKLARDLGMRGKVQFLGEQQDVAEHLRKNHVFVLVSRWEGFPRSILEAMRAGLPVVASDVGGVREAVEEGVTGHLVPRGDGRALARSLEHLASSPLLRERMGRAGRLRYEEHFTFERMFSKTLAVYEDVLRRRSGT